MNFKLDRKFFLLLAVSLFGAFLRVWHFSDWLYFKRDEARDAFAVWQAFTKGIGWLPLLGPNASNESGAKFFFGPIYYYFQYLSSLIFGSAHPAVLAYPDLLFGILAVPLFYFFLKKYFSRDWSMIVTALFAVNFLAVQYSRFAWNPNSLPFFNLLYFLSLLNIFDPEEKRPSLWAALAGLSFAVATQLHVVSQIALPVITVAFFAFRARSIRKYLDWKKTSLAVSAVLLVYVPVIINEIASGGRNTRSLFSAVRHEPYYTSIFVSLWDVFLNMGLNWFLILTGWISKASDSGIAVLTWVVFILPALWLIIRIFRAEKNERKKNFILLLFLSFFGYAAVFLPVAGHFQARFMLPIIVWPIVFLALIAQWLWQRKNIFLKISGAAVLAFVFLANIVGVRLWFNEIRDAQRGATGKFKRTVILKKQDGIVLWHLEQAAGYMEETCDESVVYYSTDREYETPIEYVLALRGTEAYPLQSYGAMKKPGCAYHFEPSRGEKKLTKNIADDFDVIGQKKFGILKISRLAFKKTTDPSLYNKVPAEKRRQILWRELK